jgi:hypothetical protein
MQWDFYWTSHLADENLVLYFTVKLRLELT